MRLLKLDGRYEPSMCRHPPVHEQMKKDIGENAEGYCQSDEGIHEHYVPEELLDQLNYPIDVDGSGTEHVLKASIATQTHRQRCLSFVHTEMMNKIRSKTVDSIAIAQQAVALL